MSKIGKRAILLLLALPIGFNVMAQETKKPTLEELIPGGESYLYAENLYGLQWWGDECIKPGIDTIYSIQPQTGKETMLITREQINKALAEDKAGKLSHDNVIQILLYAHYLPQQCLYFLPLPHGHGSFLPTLCGFTTVPDFFCSM